MKPLSLVLCLGALSAWIGVTGVAAAEDNCRGHYVTVGSKSVTISDDPTEPSHTMIGECHDGRCIRRDKDGDEMTIQSIRATGAYLDRWTLVSGTGKYANARRSGWYRLTREDGNIFVGEWGGSCD